MLPERDGPTGRDMSIDDPLEDVLASIEDLVRELGGDAEAARELLLSGDRGAAGAALQRLEERGRQLEVLRDRLLAERPSGGA
jgi:hypothetical protein